MKQRIIATTALTLLVICLQSTVTGQIDKEQAKSLTPRQQAIVLVSAFTANGELEKLNLALNGALNAGLTINETKEVIVHVYAYAGFPRSIRGLNTLISVLEERKSNGIKDETGKEASPISAGNNKYDAGKKTLERLSGSTPGPVTGYGAFSPEIDRFLKEHLFADIFGRDVLSYADRELATISVLISIGGVEPMLNSHMRIAMYQGITKAQLSDLIILVGQSVGEPEADSARNVLDEISGTKSTSNTTSTESKNLPLFPRGLKNPNPNMIGTIWLYNIAGQDSLNKTQVGNVTFEPNARTNWHSHFTGQLLLVTDGTGYHQIKGQPVQLIKKGDVIQCPPDTEHWHGATPTTFMTHIAITQNTEKGRVIWFGRVTDADYNSYLEKRK